MFFFFSSRRRHTRLPLVSWARRCVQETGINAEYMGSVYINFRKNIVIIQFLNKMSTKFRVFKLRSKNEDELVKELEGVKKQLQEAKVAKVAGGTANKLTKIRVLRKTIAKYLTVINQKQRKTVADKYIKKKYKPLDLRAKKTRALRRKLTKKQKTTKPLKIQKRELNFPLRKY
eukprot:TRINITY_DN430_c0_g1_i4.p3 TRINITY_DN430_c0_g1~~TRINITY_DN430_c0_g1_i4.p3  ORF type:complete len:174 (+),score=100.89 TRINITY_DN430_c0_g1_i4:3-524(+)